ncbi:hypothetical protein ACFPL7_11135 [Dongia soli]|uniref:Lipoprotein n=1 Tax=Dongia soli TaxID=600628 RepID=A0ABU5EBS0_9PROT|nr:hypothetical protein [Dongia soli]MDY0883504.1 hypothetical protein [Dongia soli]
MKRLITGLLLVVFAGALLGGCSETVLTRGQAANVKTVGVISAIGNELTVRDIVAQDPAGSQGSLAAFGLDHYAIEQVNRLLADRYSLIPIAYQPDDFYQSEKERAVQSFLIGGVPVGQIISHRTQIPTGTTADTGLGADIYVVLLPGKAALEDVEKPLYGASLVRLAGGPNLGIVYRIIVVDGHTLQPIANVDAMADHAVDNSYWAESFAALSESQKQQIADTWKQRLDRSLKPALQKLNLLP